jgi:hypothetical protein
MQAGGAKREAHAIEQKKRAARVRGPLNHRFSPELADAFLHPIPQSDEFLDLTSFVAMLLSLYRPVIGFAKRMFGIPDDFTDGVVGFGHTHCAFPTELEARWMPNNEEGDSCLRNSLSDPRLLSSSAYWTPQPWKKFNSWGSFSDLTGQKATARMMHKLPSW